MCDLKQLIIDLQSKNCDFEIKIYCDSENFKDMILKKINNSKIYGINVKSFNNRIISISNYYQVNKDYLEYKLSISLLSNEIML